MRTCVYALKACGGRHDEADGARLRPGQNPRQLSLPGLCRLAVLVEAHVGDRSLPAEGDGADGPHPARTPRLPLRSPRDTHGLAWEDPRTSPTLPFSWRAMKHLGMAYLQTPSSSFIVRAKLTISGYLVTLWSSTGRTLADRLNPPARENACAGRRPSVLHLRGLPCRITHCKIFFLVPSAHD